MRKNEASRLSDVPAIMRAIHQTSDGEPKILRDPIAPKLVDFAAIEANWLGPIINHSFAPRWRAGFLIRSRYAEDCLAEAAMHGVEQYLILGAGLDTFAYRQPAWAHPIHIFEADHPATQAFKREQLAKSGIEPPANLTFVPIDFEGMSFSQALRAACFAFDKPTFCSWLGVTQYLTSASIAAMLAFVLSLSRGSQIVLSFVLRQEALFGIEADAVGTAAEKSAQVGEPWLSRFDPGDLVSLLHGMGFSEVFHLTPQMAHERYLKGRHDGLEGRQGEQLIRAVV